MSEIVIKDCPCTPEHTIATKIDLEGDGFEQYYFAKFEATCTFTIGEGSPLGAFLGGLGANDIKEHELFQTIVQLYSVGIAEVVTDRNSEKAFTKDGLAAELAELANQAAEKANANFAEQNKSRISDVRFSSVTFYKSDDTTVVYKWESAASGQWTCAYCGSTVSGNFCSNCGAARS